MSNYKVNVSVKSDTDIRDSDGRILVEGGIAAVSRYIDLATASGVEEEITNVSGYLQGQINNTFITVTSGYQAADLALSGALQNDFVNVSGDTMTGFLTLHADPTASGHAATKQDVDNVVASGGSSSGGPIVEDYSQTLVFSGDTSRIFDLQVSGNAPDIIYGKLYFDQTLSGNFADTVRVEFYSSVNRVDNELIYVAEIPMAYSTISGTATSGNSSIALNSSIGFATNNLLYIQNPNAEVRRVTSVLVNNILNLKNNLENGHSIGTGVSKVGEIGSLMLFDSSSNKKIYGKVLFATAQTCSLRLDMKVRS
jgi:hypothetical protein